ncbi:hypothetical protein K440DRAFT_199602 [Wilcoxina mikolae CBS 423.85]|nr:hypothetical protein K440DRAFT_199602 [Wilcoxina mikolae CBS 423.85]
MAAYVCSLPACSRLFSTAAVAEKGGVVAAWWGEVVTVAMVWVLVVALLLGSDSAVNDLGIRLNRSVVVVKRGSEGQALDDRQNTGVGERVWFGYLVAGGWLLLDSPAGSLPAHIDFGVRSCRDRREDK